MERLCLSLHDYTELSRPNVNWIIPQILPKPSITVLMGPPFSGKSYLALQLGIHVAQCRPLFETTNTSPCRVLYIQLDTSEMVWRDRLISLKATMDLSGPIYMPHPDALTPPLNIVADQDRARLKAVVQDCNPDLVIVDVLRELHQFNENESGPQKVVFDCLVRSIGPDKAIVLLHHSKKLFGTVEDSDPVAMSRGSTYIPGRADAIWFLSKGKLKLKSRYSEDRVYNAKQQKNGLFVLSCPSSPEDPMADKTDLVRSVLGKSNGSISQAYRDHERHLTAMGISRATFFRIARLICGED